MPRKRAGAPNANRTDLLTKPQAVTTPTGLPYGENQDLQQSQQAVPVPGQVDPQAALQAATATPAPPPIHGPTERPNEPLTAGLGSGPGPGPGSLGISPNPALNTLKGVVARYGASNPQLMALLRIAEEG